MQLYRVWEMPGEKDAENSGGRIRFREASVRKKCCLRPEASVRWARENEEAGSVAGRRKACVKAQIKPVNPKGNQPWMFIKDWCWSWSSNALATWCKELTHWKRPWCWQRLRARGEAGDREWYGWMASLTQWTWIWANSGREWRTGKPSVLYRPWGHKESDVT